MEHEEALVGIAEAIRDGMMECCGRNKEGELVYRLTEQGRKKVDGMLAENPTLFVEMGLQPPCMAVPDLPTVQPEKEEK